MVAVPVAVPVEKLVNDKVDKVVNNEIDDLKKRINQLEDCCAEKSAPVAVAEPIRRDVFFEIRCNKISVAEMVKVNEVVEYMKKNPASVVEVTGYADKATGNARLNAKYAQNRTDAVVKALVAEGISESRIKADSKGDTVQPYEEQVLNRVAICIVK